MRLLCSERTPWDTLSQCVLCFPFRQAPHYSLCRQRQLTGETVRRRPEPRWRCWPYKSLTLRRMRRLDGASVSASCQVVAPRRAVRARPALRVGRSQYSPVPDFRSASRVMGGVGAGAAAVGCAPRRPKFERRPFEMTGVRLRVGLARCRASRTLSRCPAQPRGVARACDRRHRRSSRQRGCLTPVAQWRNESENTQSKIQVDRATRLNFTESGSWRDDADVTLRARSPPTRSSAFAARKSFGCSAGGLPASSRNNVPPSPPRSVPSGRAGRQ